MSFDQKTGSRLDPRLVAEARAEEAGYMEQLGVYTEVPVDECWRDTGKAPVSSKWAQVNKGTVENSECLYEKDTNVYFIS